MVGVEQKPECVVREETGMDPAQRSLWKTRGIGAFRIHRPKRTDGEWLRWIKPIQPDLPEESITWYIDAFQVDSEFDETRRFGYGIVALDPNGRLVAAALGTPPRYVNTIGQAEAHALAVVLTNTVSRKRHL